MEWAASDCFDTVSSSFEEGAGFCLPAFPSPSEADGTIRGVSLRGWTLDLVVRWSPNEPRR